MEDNVLLTIKAFLNIDEDDTDFDNALVPLINSAFMKLSMLGVIEEGTRMEDVEMTWDEVVGDAAYLETIREFVEIHVKIVWDPPTSSFVLESLKQVLAEDEWRLRTQMELKSLNS